MQLLIWPLGSLRLLQMCWFCFLHLHSDPPNPMFQPCSLEWTFASFFSKMWFKHFPNSNLSQSHFQLALCYSVYHCSGFCNLNFDILDLFKDFCIICPPAPFCFVNKLSRLRTMSMFLLHGMLLFRS